MKYVTLLILLGITIENRAETQQVENGTETGLPDYLIPCEASDEKCLKSTLQALDLQLALGIKEFQLPSILPLHVPDFNYSNSIPPDTDYTVAFTNIEFGSLNDYNVSKISIDLNHLKFLLVLTFPEVLLIADEKASGKIFGVDVNWDRSGQIMFKNLTINFSLDGTQLFKDKKRHVNWRKNKVDISADLISYDVANHFNDKQFKATFFQTVHENREFVDQEVRFLVKSTLAEYIFNVINMVHDAFPINVLYANQ